MIQHDEVKPPDGPRQQVWPRYVRVLAVSYVLTYALQPVAFLGLTGTAIFLFTRGHPRDWLLLGIGAGGIIIPVGCILFRRWFVAWGRKHYPDGKPK